MKILSKFYPHKTQAKYHQERLGGGNRVTGIELYYWICVFILLATHCSPWPMNLPYILPGYMTDVSHLQLLLVWLLLHCSTDRSNCFRNHDA